MRAGGALSFARFSVPELILMLSCFGLDIPLAATRSKAVSAITAAVSGDHEMLNSPRNLLRVLEDLQVTEQLLPAVGELHGKLAILDALRVPMCAPTSKSADVLPRTEDSAGLRIHVAMLLYSFSCNSKVKAHGTPAAPLGRRGDDASSDVGSRGDDSSSDTGSHGDDASSDAGSADEASIASQQRTVDREMEMAAGRLLTLRGRASPVELAREPDRQ